MISRNPIIEIVLAAVLLDQVELRESDNGSRYRASEPTDDRHSLRTRMSQRIRLLQYDVCDLIESDGIGKCD